MQDTIDIQAILCRLLASGWASAAQNPRAPVPWAEVAHLALRAGVGPLLCVALQGGALAPSEDILDELRQAYYRTAAQNALRYEQLGQVRQALGELPVLLLKGAALAETLYANAALRPINDLDLAVPADSVPRCRQVLLELGYAPTEVEPKPGAQRAYRGQEAFAPPDPHLARVELHWHLFDVPYYLHKVPMDWFWAHSQPSELAGQPFHILAPEANLLYLPAHLALHHRFEGLLWLTDLAILLARYQGRLDWSLVLEAAQSFELLAVLRETVQRLLYMWPGLLAPAQQASLSSLTTTPTEERLLRLLTAWPRSPLLDFYTDLVCLPQARQRVRFAWSHAFPQPAYMVGRYPIMSSWHLPYWYAIRLVAGSIKAWRTMPQVRRLELPPS